MSSLARSTRPLLLAVLGLGLLSAMDASIKRLGLNSDTLAITFGRYAFGSAFMLAPLLAGRWPRLTREAVWGNLPRGAVIAVTALAFFWAITVLPLAEAITIAFIAPLLIPPFAQLMLGERMRREVLLALAVGFAGVVVAVQGPPAGEASPLRWWGVAAVLGSAVTYAFSSILMRMRALKDGPGAVALLGNLWPVALLALPVAVVRPEFQWSGLPLLALVGLLGAGGLYLLTRAYAAAEAQMLAVSEYTALGWAALFGWVLFAEPVHWQTLAGGALIAAASLWVTWLSRQDRITSPAVASEGALP